MLRRTGLFSRRARPSASSPHGYQSTGLWACWRRYGLLSPARRLVGRGAGDEASCDMRRFLRSRATGRPPGRGTGGQSIGAGERAPRRAAGSSRRRGTARSRSHERAGTTRSRPYEGAVLARSSSSARARSARSRPLGRAGGAELLPGGERVEPAPDLGRDELPERQRLDGALGGDLPADLLEPAPHDPHDVLAAARDRDAEYLSEVEHVVKDPADRRVESLGAGRLAGVLRRLDLVFERGELLRCLLHVVVDGAVQAVA